MKDDEPERRDDQLEEQTEGRNAHPDGEEVGVETLQIERLGPERRGGPDL